MTPRARCMPSSSNPPRRGPPDVARLMSALIWMLLALLAISGASRFVVDLRAGQTLVAVLRLAAIAVLGYGVVCYQRGSGAGVGFGLALVAAMAVQAHRSWRDTRAGRDAELPAGAHVGLVLGNFIQLAAAVLGALAFWQQRGG